MCQNLHTFLHTLKNQRKKYSYFSYLLLNVNDLKTTDLMASCGWPLEKVEALIKVDPETLAMWRSGAP
jgi:hypothetical protein